MSESPTAITEYRSTSSAARLGWSLLIFATLYSCYFSHLGAIGFVGPDEPRYAWIARDMAETGDWITPRLYGKPWFEKPPLFYWGAALSFKYLGVNETAARLPSALSALLATLALAWMAWRLYGAETARWLLLLLPTSVGMIGFSHAAATDMPFSGMLTIAMVCAAVVLGLTRNENTPILPRTPWLALLLFGFFLGLAVLAKGPAAIILSGGAVFFWALFTKRWRDAFRLFHPVALVSFCATALPWYILCARRNPDFFRIFIIEHNFKRFLTPEFQHIQPFWYYGVVLLVALLPWTALAVWSLIAGSVKSVRVKQLSPNALFFLTWALFCFVFFTISRSKLPGYILPAISAVVVLMARTRFALSGEKRNALSISFFVLSLFFACGFAIVEYLTPRVSQANLNFGITVGLLLGALSVANLLFGVGVSLSKKRAFGTAVAACSVLPVLLALSVTDRLLPSFFYQDPSGQTISAELKRAGLPVGGLCVYKSMSRGQRYSLNYYLHEEIPEWDGKHPQEGYLLIGHRPGRSDVGLGFTFEEVPFDLNKTGYFLYKVQKQLPNRPARSGQPQ